MEPLDPGRGGATLPPPGSSAPAPRPHVAPDITAGVAVTAPASWTATPPTVPATSGSQPQLRPMAPWRIVGASALAATFGLIGWQVHGLIDDRPWSTPVMWLSVVTALVVATCVLGWTWIATDNARRLVGPAGNRQLPDPKRAVATWILPFVFVGVAVGVVAVLGARSGVDAPGTDEAVSALPLAAAVIALLLAIPMTYRPLNHLAGVLRQVGGYSARLAQWMWVPVVMGLVGIGSIVALRFAGVDEGETGTVGPTGDAASWAPLWVVAVVAIAPCVIVVLLAWRAAASFEDAIRIAWTRRYPAASPASGSTSRSPRTTRARLAHGPTDPIELVPGADVLRLLIVTLLAGLALLSVVGAAVTFIFWLEARDTGLLPSERGRTWDALDVLWSASSAVTLALVAVVSVWSFVSVLNVRIASGRRRNPLVAALAWPAAAFGVWWIADRMIVEQSTSRVVAGFAAQAAVLVVPFLLLERSADAIGARRTPLRIVYVLAVVVLVHVQGLGGLSSLPETTTDVGRLAGYLLIGALIQLCSTLAVTEACRGISQACRHEVDHHNMLVDHRNAVQQATTPQGPR